MPNYVILDEKDCMDFNTKIYKKLSKSFVKGLYFH